MASLIFYHYVSKEKYQRIKKVKAIEPSAPFNSKINDKNWSKYAASFPFGIAKFYTFAFFEPCPKGWRDYGLFDLLMEEFSRGDLLLKITIDDNGMLPILVRDHKFHSPKMYGYPGKEWQKRKIRDSRPDLRIKWYKSTIPLQFYQFDYICPEALIPFKTSIKNITVVQD